MNDEKPKLMPKIEMTNDESVMMMTANNFLSEARKSQLLDGSSRHKTIAFLSFMSGVLACCEMVKKGSDVEKIEECNVSLSDKIKEMIQKKMEKGG